MIKKEMLAELDMDTLHTIVTFMDNVTFLEFRRVVRACWTCGRVKRHAKRALELLENRNSGQNASDLSLGYVVNF